MSSLAFGIDESREAFAREGENGGCGIDSGFGLVEDNGTVADGNDKDSSMSDGNFLFVSSWNRPLVTDFFA